MDRSFDPEPFGDGGSAAFGDQLSALWRGLPLILGCALVALGAAIGWVATREPVYRAETKVVVGYGATVALPDVREGAEVLTQTMAELVDSDILAERVIEATGADLDAVELREHLSVSTQPSAAVLEIAYEDPDPGRARRILAQVAEEFLGLVGTTPGVNGPLTGTNPSAVVFDPSHVLPDPVAPRPVLTAAVATMLGVALGVAVVLARASRRRAREIAWAQQVRRIDGARQRHRESEPHPQRARRRR